MMKPPPKTAAVDDDAVWLPEYFAPSPRDVVCGWARQHHRHAGNQRFRKLVEYSAPLYVDAKTKVEKTQVIASVVQKVRRDSPGGGFVKRDFHSSRWYEIGDDKARDKVGHAIRRVIDENKKKSKKVAKFDKKLKTSRPTDTKVAKVAPANANAVNSNDTSLAGFNGDSVGKSSLEEPASVGPAQMPTGGLALGDEDQNLINAYLEQRDSTMAKGLMGSSSFSTRLPMNVNMNMHMNNMHSMNGMTNNNMNNINTNNINLDSSKMSQLGSNSLMQQHNMLLQNQSNQSTSPYDFLSLQSNSINTNNMLMSQSNMVKNTINGMPSIVTSSNLHMNSALFNNNNNNGNQYDGPSSQATASFLLNSLENNTGALSSQQQQNFRNFGF